VEEGHYGGYTCEAANPGGRASVNVTLYRSKIAICPPVCGDVNVTDGAASSRVVLALVLVLVVAAFSG